MKYGVKSGLVQTDERVDGLVPSWPSTESGLVGPVPIGEFSTEFI